MAEQRFGGVHKDGARFQVTGAGVNPGPGGGDGWQVVCELPSSKLPDSAAVRLAIVVKGIIGNVSVSGAAPVNGVLQLCLGQNQGGGAGPKSTTHFTELRVTREQQSPTDTGTPFTFVMVQQALDPGVALEIIDSTFGSAYSNSGQTGTPWCLWARLYWNTDAAAYAVSWDVMDVEWLWLDMDVLQSRGAAVAQLQVEPGAGTGVTVGPSWQWMHQALLDPTAMDETWLHLSAVYFESRTDGLNPGSNQGTTQWQFGYSTAGPAHSSMVPLVGEGLGPIEQAPGGSTAFPDLTVPWWGQNRCPLNSGGKTLQAQGCLFIATRESANFSLSIRARSWPSMFLGRHSSLTYLRRSIFLSVNITAVEGVLDDVTVRDGNLTEPNAAPPYGLPDLDKWRDYHQDIVRTDKQVLTDPVLFAHSAVAGYHAGHGVTDDLEVTTKVPWQRVSAGTYDCMGVMTFHQFVFPAEQPDTQLQLTTAYEGTSIGPFRKVGSIHLACVDLVFERAANIPEPPWVEPEATWLQLGSEGLEAPLQAALIYPPDHVQQVAVIGVDHARIDGQHYSRAWPLFAQPRRRWSLTWTSDDTSKVRDFLDDYPVFKMRPHDESLGNFVVVTQAGPYEVDHLPGGQLELRVDVIELIFLT